MQAQVSSTRTVTGTSKPVLKALGSTLLAVAVAAGMGLWHGTGQQDRQAASTTASQQAEPAAVEYAATAFGSSATPGQIHGTVLGQRSVIYIAGSGDEAAWVRRFTAEVNALAMEAGRPANSVTALVANSVDNETKLQAHIAHIRAMQQDIGLPVSQVFDLRAG